MPQQPSAWIDIYHGPGGPMVGIECDDKSLTFDGHYICLFPKRDDEDGLDGAHDRAALVLDYMRGKRQFQRR